MGRVIEPKKTPEQLASEAQAKEQKNAALADNAIASITKEQAEIAETDEMYRKALNERADLTLIPQGKVAKNHTVKQVNDNVYPGDMVICERL
jgi:hypothetical protein